MPQLYCAWVECLLCSLSAYLPDCMSNQYLVMLLFLLFLCVGVVLALIEPHAISKNKFVLLG